jgi:hypothetical protein
MNREEILQRTKAFNRIEELTKNNWKKYIDENHQNSKKPSFHNNNPVWIFYHELEPGLWAKFKENTDGTWTFLNSWDELKEKKIK